MLVEVRIESTCAEPRVILITDKMTEDIQSIIKMIEKDSPKILTGLRGGKLEVLEPDDIIRIYASAGKVFAVTDRGEYIVRPRLYELEHRMEKNKFVRISNSDIINLRKVKNFDLSFSGTICVRLSNDMVTYVSRRFVAKIKQILGL